MRFSIARVAVERETARVLAAWGTTGLEPLTVDGTYVVLKPLPFTTGQTIGKLAGLAIPASRTILVGYSETKTIGETAFAHELGHQILANAGESPDEATLKSYHDQFGIPY